MSAHIPLDESYAGVHFESRSPDVVVVDAFLSSSECDELVAEGKSVELEESPVVYAGWCVGRVSSSRPPETPRPLFTLARSSVMMELILLIRETLRAFAPRV